MDPEDRAVNHAHSTELQVHIQVHIQGLIGKDTRFDYRSKIKFLLLVVLGKAKIMANYSYKPN